jgi:hypothetical protein
VCTSNAIKDDPSVLTLVTSAADDDNLSAIDEVVDKIPAFAGGGGGGRSTASGITSQAVMARFTGRGGGGGGGGGGDDRSVASFGTMTTMGDLGSIVETAENLEDEDDYADMDALPSLQYVHPYHQRSRLSSLSATLVDVIPEATSSVASGTTNHSIRVSVGEDYDDNASVNTFGTMTTAGGGGRVEVEQNQMNNNPEGGGVDGDDDAVVVVDHVPTYPTNGCSSTSIVSGTTNRAVRLNDDQSVATWATAATSGVGINEHVVDKMPSFSTDDYERAERAAEEEERTNCAVKDPDDQSVATWTTMTTAASGMGARSASALPLPMPLPRPYAVDRVPSFLNKGPGMGASLSGTTNHAIRVGGGDDQSVVTFATMTTVGGGGMDRAQLGCGGEADIMVDKVPLFVPPQRVSSIITDDTVQMGDNESLATWGTTNTMGRQMTGNVVDHIPAPSSFDSEEDRTVGTTNALKEDRSVTTFTTSATSCYGVRCIDEVVDKIPTFAGGAGRSVMSGITDQAIRNGDDRSVLSFATMTTAGADLVSPYETDIQLESSTNLSRRYRFSNNVVDRIPVSAGRGATTSIVSGRTDNAIRLGDDATFATLTTAGWEGDPSNAPTGGDGNNDGLSGIISSRGVIAPPATSVLRSALRSRSHSGSAVVVGGADTNELPIDVGESVSNTHILRAIADFRFHVDNRIVEMRELHRRDSDRGE